MTLLLIIVLISVAYDCLTCTANGGADQLCGWCATTSKCILAKAAGLNAGINVCNPDEACDPSFKECCAMPCKENPTECDGKCANFIGNLKLKNPTFYTQGNKTGNPNPACPNFYTKAIVCDGETKCCSEKTEGNCLKTDYGGAITCGWCSETDTCDVLKYQGFNKDVINGAPSCVLIASAAALSPIGATAAVLVLIAAMSQQ